MRVSLQHSSPGHAGPDGHCIGPKFARSAPTGPRGGQKEAASATNHPRNWFAIRAADQTRAVRVIVRGVHAAEKPAHAPKATRMIQVAGKGTPRISTLGQAKRGTGCRDKAPGCRRLGWLRSSAKRWRCYVSLHEQVHQIARILRPGSGWSNPPEIRRRRSRRHHRWDPIRPSS